MILSMTGYAKAENTNQSIKVLVELKSLNNKGIDIYLKLPSYLKLMDLDLRNTIQNHLIRGKVDGYIEITPLTTDSFKQYNAEAFKIYFNQLQVLIKDLKLKESDFLQSVLFKETLHHPNVQENNESDILTEENKNLIKTTLIQCCTQIEKYRKTEGTQLEKDILSQINLIEKSQKELMLIEPKRKEKVREKLKGLINENVESSKINYDRLEQEMLYYLEKLDVNEEIVRLNSHLIYFKDIIKKEENAGKKLAFLTQEIGREINTIGSKANDDVIQKTVVEMKDILEKIREQLNNVL